jgi:phospholipase/carboxylesterase
MESLSQETLKMDGQAKINERSLRAEVKLYYDVYAPESGGPRPLLLALHGYGSSKRHIMREAQEMAPVGFAVAALQGLHQHIRQPREKGGPLRFGFGWLTSFQSEEYVTLHHKFILDVIAQLTNEGVADPQNLFLLGFSQTCALNFRFAFTHPDILRGVVGMCGGIPGDWAANELYQLTKAPVFYLHGTQDEFYPPAQIAANAAKLRERAADVTLRAYDAGHDFTQPMRDDIRQWLNQHTV